MIRVVNSAFRPCKDDTIHSVGLHGQLADTECMLNCLSGADAVSAVDMQASAIQRQLLLSFCFS